MWPARLPAEIRNHPLRRAEVKVYDALAAQLDDSWTVFYSRPWLGLTASGEEIDGECDFFVVHPDHGYLAIEVKGGGIFYDPALDKWTSRNREKLRKKIKDPVQQARSAKHEFLKRLREQRAWPSSLYIRIRHGVVFPDAKAPPRNLGPDRPREIFCCKPQMPALGDWVRGRLTGGTGQPIGRQRLRVFEDLLARPFILEAPLAHWLAEDDAVISTLTPRQFLILNAIQDVHRAAVGGGAGTGKTILAIEDALRLSRTGLKTVLTCLSPRLAVDLRSRLKGKDIQVATFSELCDALSVSAGLGSVAHLSPEQQVERMLKAVETDPSIRPQAIIVDEAQDFPAHWWVAIDAALAPGGETRLHAFYDTNQKVYGAVRGQLASFALVPINLSCNYRNTQLIHQVCDRFYEGLPVTAEGPEGTPVEWIDCAGKPLVTSIAQSVRRLIGEDAVPPADVAVLTASKALRDELIAGLPQPITEGLVITDIADFKGLERLVVVVAAEPELVERPELLYVALSRARTHMLLVGDTAVLDWMGRMDDTEDGLSGRTPAFGAHARARG
jgi:hypothetical protein